MRNHQKQIFKILFSLIVMGILLLPQDAEAADEPVHFTKFTDNSVTISWDISSYLTGELSEYYTVHSVLITESDSLKTDINSVLWKSSDLTKKQITFSNLKKGYTNYLTVWVDCTVKQSGRKEALIIGNTYVNTTPQTPKQSSFYVQNIGGTKPTVDFGMNPPKSKLKYNSFGMQVELCQQKNGKRICRTTNTYASYRIKRDTIYKYRARVYWRNISTQKTYYGDWSSWKYFDLPTVKIKLSEKNGIQLTVKKCSKVKSYTVYVSKKYDSGYKKSQTIKMSSKSKRTVKITKYGKNKIKKGQIYYIKVVPNIKIGSKTTASEAAERNSIYLPKKK